MRATKRIFAFRSLISRLLFCLISTAVSACAPNAWRNEARLFSHLGDWNMALNRYEDSLLSGQATSGVYEGASLSIDELSRINLNELPDSIDSSALSSAHCQNLITLEQLSPAMLDRLRYTEFSPPSRPLSAHDLAAELLRLEQSSSCPLNGQWLNEWRLATLLEREMIKLAQSVNNIEEIELLDRSIEQLSALSLPFSILSDIKHTLNAQRLELWHQHALVALSQHQWSLAQLFSEFSRNEAPLVPSPSNVLTDFVESEQSLLLAKLSRPLISVSPLSKPSSIISKLRQVESEMLRRVDPIASSHLERELSLPQRAEVIFTTSEVHCEQKVKKTSREVRYQEELTQVLSPKYLSALKRVEESQARYEKAQSDREELERSILVAQAEFSVTTAEVNTHQSLAQKQQTELSLLFQRRDHELRRLNTLTQALELGPPRRETCAKLSHSKAQVKTWVDSIKKLKIAQEIAQSALDDYLNRHQKKREEVQRLSSYLVKTVRGVTEAERLLDERELALKELPKHLESSTQSVFRYPAFEERFTCTLSVEAKLKETQQDRRNEAAPSSSEDDSWRITEVASRDVLTHRAYPRYKVSAVKSSKTKIYRALKNEIKSTLTRRMSEWLMRRRIKRLSVYGPSLYRERGDQLSDEALTLLARLSPSLVAPLLDRLRDSLSLSAPLTALRAAPL